MPGDLIPEAVATRADTLRALAEKLGIDADNFEATIERFNQLVAWPGFMREPLG